LLLADTCADFPVPFDLRAPLAAQQRQLDEAYERVAASSAENLFPFLPEEALLGVDLCLGWPAPNNPPPRSQHGEFPKVPTLVLEGGLDTVPPPHGARSVAAEFPDSRYIAVPFVGHIAASRDESLCAASIAAAFLGSKAIDTACLSRISPPVQVDAFPERFAQVAPITPLANHGTAELSADELRVITVTRDTVSDIMRRWAPLQIYSGLGLRGGTFTTIRTSTPGHFGVRLDAVRWTTDSTVTGTIFTSPTSQRLSGSVVVSNPFGRARFAIRSLRILDRSTQATITGRINGRDIDITVDAKLGL